MRLWQIARGVGALAALAIAGCKSLDVQNPNEPSSKALTDPDVLEAVAAGTLRTWMNGWTGTLETTGVVAVQARTLSSSWNNGNMNFYSGIDIAASDTAAAASGFNRNTRTWQNNPAAAGRTSIEGYWYQFYSTLSSANDALKAIRQAGVFIGDAATTKRDETIAALTQGASLMGIALMYDKGYYVDENFDANNPAQVAALQYVTRKELKDSAEKRLLDAVALANANTFDTPTGWTNDALGMTNAQVAKLANTLLAMLEIYYPRDDGETGTVVNWSKVATYASAGISTGADSITFAMIGDGCTAWCQVLMPWFTDYSSGRVSTRVAHFVDPATQMDPYPLGIGSPQPNSPDKRMGDGSYGNASMVGVYDNVPKTANAGTDFAYSATGEIFRPARGYYHQSNIGFTRFDESGVEDPEGQWAGFGYEPIITPAVNDLIWAEALLHVGGAANIASAVALINKTRVTRGGLAQVLIAEPVGALTDGPCMSNNKLAKDGGICTIFSKLLYELEVELLQMGPAGYLNQRRLPVLLSTAWERSPGCVPINPCPNRNTNGARYIQGLLPGTPREMPVPAKELGVKAEALYTFGGATPKGSETP
jgi:hypothetical protein